MEEKDVIKIYESNKKYQELAKEYSVSISTITSIKTDRNWSWLTHGRKKGRADVLGENKESAKLNEKSVKEILKSKECLEELACKYNVSKTTIYKVKKGLTWKHIER